VKLLVDMNLSPQLAPILQARGFETVHWSAVGSPLADDTEIMGYAAANGLVVLTHDLDFSAILAATNGDKPSVVQIRANDLSSDLLVDLIVAGLRRCERELAEGALLTVDADRQRLRLLPLNIGS
jgi:predicted nuclease of predicted toxin-antitoxin system